MKTLFVRFNKQNLITGIHKAYVAALSNLDQYFEQYCSVKEVDLTGLCNLDTLKKGDTVQGIWDFVTQHEVDKRMVNLMVMQLRHEFVDSDETASELRKKGLTHKNYLVEELHRDSLTFDAWMEKYLEAGEARLAELEEKKLEEAEIAALKKANLEAIEEYQAKACISLPGIAGRMGADIYYTVQVPFAQLRLLFGINDESLPIELRAQRPVNAKRAQAICDYIIDRSSDYTLPALTASVSEKMTFIPAQGFTNVGSVQIPIGSNLINDGQTRYSGCLLALEKMPSLKNQSISIVIFYDQGLERSQQIFSDINDNALKPSGALSVLFDKTSILNQLINESLEFTGLKSVVDYENTTIKAKSSKVWSVIAIKRAIELLTGLNKAKADKLTDDEYDYHKRVVIQWLEKFVKSAGGDLAGIIKSESMVALLDARKNKINTHVAYLHAAAIASREILNLGFTDTTFDKLIGLKDLSVSKTAPIWSERLVGKCGKMNPSVTGIKLGAAVMLKQFDIGAPEDIAELESLMFEAA